MKIRQDWRRWASRIVILTGLAGALAACHGEPGELAGYTFPEGTLVVGHGGAKELCPANTLECFRHALDVGANALEVDLQVLGDGTLVTYHDSNTLRQTGEDHDLDGLTLDVLERLDAGWGFSPDGGETFPYRGQGIGVPTFEAFLEAFRGVPVLLDVKVDTAAMAEALFAFVVADFDAVVREFVYIKTHDQGLTDRLRVLDPPPRVAFNTVERILLALSPGRFDGYPPTWLDLNREFLLPHMVAWSERQCHILTVSTVDEVDEMERLLAIEGVDGLVTDRPDLLRRLLDR